MNAAPPMNVGAPLERGDSGESSEKLAAENKPPSGSLSSGITHEELFHFHRWRENPPKGRKQEATDAATPGGTAAAAPATRREDAAEEPWRAPRLLRCRDSAAVLQQQQLLQQQGWDLTSSRAQQELVAAEAESSRGALWGSSIPAPHLHYCATSCNGASSRSTNRRDFRAYLLPLRAGEWLAVRRAVWFRVVRGLAECRGHFFPPSSTYHLVVSEGPPPPEGVSGCSSLRGLLSGSNGSGSAATTPGIRITALPGPEGFATDHEHPQREQQQQQQPHYEEGFQVAEAFLEDFVSARFPVCAFKQNFDECASVQCSCPLLVLASSFCVCMSVSVCNFSLWMLCLRLGSLAVALSGALLGSLAGSKDCPRACSDAPAALRLLQVDGRLQRTALATPQIEGLLNRFDRQIYAESLGRCLCEGMPLLMTRAGWCCCCRWLAASQLVRLFGRIRSNLREQHTAAAAWHTCSTKDRGCWCSCCRQLLPTVIVWGGKGTGKSCLVSFLINYTLNFFSQVYLLEADVGQPICSTPGSTTLLSFTSPLLTPPHILLNAVDAQPPEAFPEAPAVCFTRAASEEQEACEGLVSSSPPAATPEVVILEETQRQQHQQQQQRRAGYRVVRQVFFGDVNPKSAPHRYLRCIDTCLAAYRGNACSGEFHEAATRDDAAPRAAPEVAERLSERCSKIPQTTVRSACNCSKNQGNIVSNKEACLTAPLIVNSPGWTDAGVEMVQLQQQDDQHEQQNEQPQQPQPSLQPQTQAQQHKGAAVVVEVPARRSRDLQPQAQDTAAAVGETGSPLKKAKKAQILPNVQTTAAEKVVPADWTETLRHIYTANFPQTFRCLRLPHDRLSCSRGNSSGCSSSVDGKEVNSVVELLRQNSRKETPFHT
ncbi:uncharacterized protein LOC34617282 [Cyclospora cayetanensis]|uniref:Uncharacterized protein LOC34617282 n=1 Tax=Cyclospora cayetanensis TaxID=88456 RepID=A0A6P6S3A3_9EIME|nr:uncharacterized protein LOC34617282 [Cyclospora cayetanensis]